MTSGTGTCTLTASQSGNANYSAASNVVRTVDAAKAAQTIGAVTFSVSPPVTFATGGTFTVSATATSSLAVTFTSLTASVCTVAGTTVTMVTAGTCTIAANQGGNGNYLAAAQASGSINIAKADQTISFTIGDQFLSPTPVTLNGTATSGLAVKLYADRQLHRERQPTHAHGDRNLHSDGEPGWQRELQRRAGCFADVRHPPCQQMDGHEPDDGAALVPHGDPSIGRSRPDHRRTRSVRSADGEHRALRPGHAHVRLGGQHAEQVGESHGRAAQRRTRRGVRRRQLELADLHARDQHVGVGRRPGRRTARITRRPRCRTAAC